MGRQSTLFSFPENCKRKPRQVYSDMNPAESLKDVPALIKYPTRSSPTLPSHHLSVYRVATLATIPLIVSLLLFWTITHGQASLVLAWDLLPQSYLFLLVLFFLLPLQFLSRSGRYRFLSTLKRVSIGGIAEAQDGKFGDILLADALTSYAKVLGDLFVSGCMFFSSRYSSTDKPDRGCGGAYMVPLIISIPSLIRLRQCLIEYSRVRKANQKGGGSGSSGWGGQHLANALKYSSAFPVIILSALQRGYDPNKIGMSETALFRLWYDALKLFTSTLAYCLIQAFCSVFELVLLFLLGRRQRLGPHALRLLIRAQQSGTSLGSAAAHSLSHQRNVLRRHRHRPHATMHLEL